MPPRPASCFASYVKVRFLLTLALCSAGFAQQYEMGGAGGYGIYRSATVFAPAGTAQAGFRNRFALSGVFCDDMYERISGELRYLYHDGDAYVSSGAKKTDMEGQSHAIHYDVLFHLRKRREKLRPYVAAGGGAKIYVGTGPPMASQPLSSIAYLRDAPDAKALLTFGFGVKYALKEELLLRVDFRDYLTQFPKGVIVPAPSANPRGLMQQFTVLFGISHVFGGKP